MFPGSAEYKFIVVMLGVEALAYLGAALWFGSRSAGRSGAALAVLGGILAGVSAGLNAAASFQSSFLDSTRLAQFLYFDHEHLQTVLIAARVLGVVLLVVGAATFVRTRTAASPPYGPS